MTARRRARVNRSVSQSLSLTLHSPNAKWHRYNQQQLRTKPLILGASQRKAIEAAIRETCGMRKWSLFAFNVRTNHVHTVVTANRKSEQVLTAFKANATRQLREDGLWLHGFSPWARKGSKTVERAKRCQGDRLCTPWAG
ncbi:MAG: transposase [Pyrinomonadaceae bacterium]